MKKLYLLWNGIETSIGEKETDELLGENAPITLLEILDGYGYVTERGVLYARDEEQWYVE
jgi:hypothetical protein